MTLTDESTRPGPDRGSRSTLGQSVEAAVRDSVATAIGHTKRDDQVTPRLGGPAGNARLTAWAGLILLVFFLAETATLISVGQLITVHILIGAFLVPVVLLKTGVTGWRILRYYAGSPSYRQAGPPPLLLRLLGPLVVLTSLGVVGSGLALIALGHSSYSTIVSVAGFSINAVTLHQGAFIVWGVVTVLHLLGRLVPSIKLARGEGHAGPVPGGALRVASLVLTVALGVGVALLVLHFSGNWTHHSGFGHDGGPH